MVCGKLVENNSPNATRRKQLVESKGRKTGRKLTRRTEIFSFTHKIAFVVI